MVRRAGARRAGTCRPPRSFSHPRTAFETASAAHRASQAPTCDHPGGGEVTSARGVPVSPITAAGGCKTGGGFPPAVVASPGGGGDRLVHSRLATSLVQRGVAVAG